MSKEYEEIKIYFGDIENAVNTLKSKEKEEGHPFKLEFNGHWLYSDAVTLDSAYKEITGMTKKEHDNRIDEHRKAIEEAEREHQESLPEQEKYYIEEGHRVLSEDKWEEWDEIVPIRLRDLYRGMELGNCLDIVEILDNEGSLEDAKEEIESQGHSGMSWGLVGLMVKTFSDRGEEFVNFLENEER